MKFKNKIYKHLSNYKKEHYPDLLNGKWRSGLEKEYILPQSHSDLNIIHNYRNEFLNSEYARIKRHMYFHHLNSSQAMCINFFFPLIQECMLEVILVYLGLND